METKNKTEEIKKYFQSQLKETFNESKFDDDVLTGKPISIDNLDEYKKKEKEPSKSPKKPKENNFSNNRGLSFHGGFKDGQWVAVGSNGHIIKSKDIDDFNRQLAQVFKLNALKNGKEPECTLRVGENEPKKQELMESYARNFINAGVVVKGDVPQSPEFWQTLKENYLAQKGHNLENWNRLTRFVPKEYMNSKENSAQYLANTKQKEISPRNISPVMNNKVRGSR